MFTHPDQPEWILGVESSDDGRFLLASIFRGTNPENQLHVLDMTQPDANLRALADDKFLHSATKFRNPSLHPMASYGISQFQKSGTRGATSYHPDMLRNALPFPEADRPTDLASDF